MLAGLLSCRQRLLQRLAVTICPNLCSRPIFPSLQHVPWQSKPTFRRHAATQTPLAPLPHTHLAPPAPFDSRAGHMFAPPHHAHAGAPQPASQRDPQVTVFMQPGMNGWRCRYAGRWLSAMIYDDGPPDKFKMVIGISDGGTYEDDRPTWLSPLRYQDKCYVGDAKNPAGDVAAMVRLPSTAPN